MIGSEFKTFAQAVNAQFRAMAAGELYETGASDLYTHYLGAFPAGTNPLFRERTEHDCSCCRNFIHNIGNVVAIIDEKVVTVWDVEGLPHPYDVVAKRLADLVRQQPITSIYRTDMKRYGAEKNVEVRDGQTFTWNHFWCDVPKEKVSASPAAVRGEGNTTAAMLKRALNELSPEAFTTVLDLIDANSLYRGAEFRPVISEFLALRLAYEEATDKELFAWANYGKRGARFRNSSIGDLVAALSAGEDLEKAVGQYEAKVAPENYKRSSAVITPKMIEQAVTKLRELGLEPAIERRMAKIADVSVNDVLFVDNSVKGKMKGGLEALLMTSVRPATVDVKNPMPITADEFFENVVPNAVSIDLLVKNKMMPQFMTMTAPVHPDASRLFKWNNGFAWAYEGDLADSSIRERVKKAGGNVDAPLRVSLSWHNGDDLDLHAICPDGHIYFRGKKGILDVDMNGLDRHDAVAPVENLSWQRYSDGRYTVSVHQFHLRSRENVGFEVEFFFNGETHTLSYPKMVLQGQEIRLVEWEIVNGALRHLKFGPGLSVSSASKNKWGIDTETLVPVDTLLASPNHWGGQAVGNKHWFFILKGCKNPEPARGIYNEFLRSDLEPHRKVFEALGAKTKCEPTNDQLSGIGFSSTRSDEATVVVKGRSRIKAYNIKF
jgi:uncharacterized protein YfaP (DUF2135 family)